MNQTLASVQQSLAGLQAEAAAAGQPLPAEPAPSAGAPVTARGKSDDYTDPVKVSQLSDPPGWERIYEGSFLEAVLVTQLSGDFPGPMLAMVSVPFYSADRQRVLVPRGAKVLGTASAVANQDQTRLAVGFHRLLFPGRPLGCARVSGPQSGRRGGIERPGEPALCLHVYRRRCYRRSQRADSPRLEPLCRRHGGLQGRSGARTRPERHPDPAAFLESLTHYHDSRRAPAARLVHFRRAGSPAPSKHNATSVKRSMT